MPPETITLQGFIMVLPPLVPSISPLQACRIYLLPNMITLEHVFGLRLPEEQKVILAMASPLMHQETLLLQGSLQVLPLSEVLISPAQIIIPMSLPQNSMAVEIFSGRRKVPVRRPTGDLEFHAMPVETFILQGSSAIPLLSMLFMII